jgi:hypothetical protein
VNAIDHVKEARAAQFGYDLAARRLILKIFTQQRFCRVPLIVGARD